MLNDSRQNISEIQDHTIRTLYAYLGIFDILILCVTSIFAVTTWILIPKWRCYRNYIFLNLIISFAWVASNPLIKRRLLKNELSDMNIWAYTVFASFDLFALTSFEAWIFLAALVFYMDLVTIFEKKIFRKIFKSNLFAFVFPFVNSVIFFLIIAWYRNERDVDFLFINYICNKYKMIVCLVFVFAHLFIYIQVLRSILKLKDERRLKIQVSLIIFSVSGLFIITCLLFCYVQDHGGTVLTFTHLAIKVSLTAQTIAFGFIFTFGLKSNRALWKEYWRKLNATALLGADRRPI